MKRIVLKNWRDKRWITAQPPGVRSDGSEVLAGLDAHLSPSGPVSGAGGAVGRPVVRLRYVDAELLYASWVWDHQADEPRLTVFERADVDAALGRLARALPTPLPGETGAQALERAIGSGELLDPVRELELAHELTGALLPVVLGLELNRLEALGLRPVLRVQASPSTAQVPWELLGADGHERALDMMDVAMLLPASIRNDPERTVSPWTPDGPVVGVLDPAVPGYASSSDLGSVLGPVADGSPLSDRVGELGARLRPRPAHPPEAFRRTDLDRLELARLLGDAGAVENGGSTASRLLYVGHVTGSTHALDARLHLADDAETPGRADLLGAHRPYSAADIAVGAPGLEPLHAPNRVALVACDSGGDLRFAEPTGLVAAFAHRGAEYVTATRWTLPTDAGLARFGLGDRAAGVLADAVLAVDAAHDAPDPVVALAAWQRRQRERWSETGDPRYSPIVWGAFMTAWSPERPSLSIPCAQNDTG
ncbi:hypothetical protein [Leucobacter sp. gxy201]|uniref:hypothetical protein n=1 Tax=Leucobacter sp. gxy201 TaxID=2957200 RepID=UPI003DA19B61